MHSFLIKYRIGNKTSEEEIMASNKEEARIMMINSLGWDNPKQNIKIISVKSLHPTMKRLKPKQKRNPDSFGY